MKHSIRSAVLAGPAFLLWSFLVTTGEARAQVPADDCALLGPANEYPVADPCVPVPMNTNGMSPSFNPGGCGATNGDDAWAWFTATTEQTEVTYTVTGCAGLLCGIFTVPVLHVFSGADCDSLELASCALGTLGIGGTATVTINTEVGDPYWVRVQRIVFNDDMEGTLCIKPLTVAPVNDDCANAIPVGNGTHPFSSVGATGSYISSCAWSDTSDVWFSYTATCADQLRVTTCDDADFDTTVSIFDACGGTELVCHDDHYGCANYTSTAILNNVVPGQTYLIRIAGFEGATGTGNVTITCGPPPPPADNDDCANAVPIGDGIHPFNVESATGTMVSSCSWMDHNDVWFEYTASCTGLAMVSTCGTAYFNTTLSVFDACEGNELACSDNFPDCLFFTSATSFSTVEGHTYMVRVAGFNGDQGNGEIVIACSPVTWYSQASGNATDPIWSHMPVGPPDHAIFSHTMNVVVQDGHDVVQDTSMLHAMQFIVEDGAAWTMGDGHVLSLSANYMGHGTVNTTGSTVALDGEATQIIMGTGTLGFHDLAMNNAATAIAQADLDIRGTLQLNAGTFNANGRTITLVSDAQGSARLGPVATGASYTGDLTVQRWVPGGVTNWRLLGSPVAGATINDWKDDFFTAGFPGSHFPPFYDPPTSTDLWPSIRWYDETDPGTDWMDGLTGVAAHTTPLTMGQGFAAWSGDNLAGTAPFTLDLSGPPHIATAPIALPMSWTDTGVPATDGWNLVSNPLPGPVLFSQLDRGTDVDNAYQLFDPVSGNFATWNGTVGTLGATDTIQSFQGFFLKANGPAHAVTVSETAKVLAPTGGHFGGLLSAGPPALRLQVASGMNAFRDEALVMFSDGQPGFDAAEGDVLRIPFAHPQAPSIATKAADGGALTINMHGEPQGGLLIPVMLHTGLSGTYTITATGTEGINGLSCLVLEDLLTGTRTVLHEGATHTFQLEADADPDQPRMLIHATAMIGAQVEAVSCHGQADGAITVDNSGGAPIDITWTDEHGAVVASYAAVTGPVTLGDLPAGTYQMAINGLECPGMQALFHVPQPAAMEVAATVTPASCAGVPDGSIELTVLGGTAPHAFLWSTGDTGHVIEAAGGEHAVTVTDAAGCVTGVAGLVIEAPAPIPGDIVAPQEAAPFTAVVFQSTAAPEVAHEWDLGDGQTSAQPVTVHSYGTPGTYMVTLTLDDGACHRTLEHVLAVAGNTVIDNADGHGLRAWSAEGWIVLEGDMPGPMAVEVLDATGRTVHSGQVPARTPTTRIATVGWPAGLYFLRVRMDDHQRTFPLPVVR